jgi:hypothetical protein
MCNPTIKQNVFDPNDPSANFPNTWNKKLKMMRLFMKTLTIELYSTTRSWYDDDSTKYNENSIQITIDSLRCNLLFIYYDYYYVIEYEFVSCFKSISHPHLPISCVIWASIHVYPIQRTMLIFSPHHYSRNGWYKVRDHLKVITWANYHNSPINK